MYGLCMIYVWSKYDLCMEKYGNIGHGKWMDGKSMEYTHEKFMNKYLQKYMAKIQDYSECLWKIYESYIGNTWG